MLVHLSPDQESLRDSTARFLADKATPAALRSLRDDPAGFDAEYWRQGVQLGWTPLLVDPAHGGGSVSGNGLVDLTLIAYEFGRHAAPGPLLVNAVVAGALSRHGGHQDVVDGLLTGERLATWALHDARAGQAGDRRVTVRRDGNDLVLSGVKRPVESASRSNQLLVVARSTGAQRSEGATPELTQVLVPADADGLSFTPMFSVDLTRRFDVVTFDDVRVPKDSIVGEFGAAGYDVEHQLLQALVISASESVGAMQAAFDMTLEWTHDRYSFGRPLASYQAIKHRMAAMKTWLEAAHAITDEAAESGSAKLAAAAAAYVGEQGSELMHECVQFHGGIGVTYEHDLHLFLRRHTLNRASYGTPSSHRQRVAAAVAAEASVREQIPA